MKKSNSKLPFILSIFFILFTGVINIYGLFNLPKQIATQISFTGEKGNRMATPIYLIGAFAIVVILTLFYIRAEKEQKIKWLLTDILIVIANSVMIIIQL